MNNPNTTDFIKLNHETPQTAEHKRFDTLFAWFSVIMGFLFIRALPVVENTLGAFLLILLLFGFAACYFLCSGIRLHFSALSLTAIACVLSVGLITGANKILHRILFFLVILAFFYSVYCACGLAGRNPFSADMFSHAIRAIVQHPFSALSALPRALPPRGKRGSTRYLLTIAWCLLGLVVTAVPTLIVVLLLSYDAQFTSLLKKIFSISLDGFWGYLRDLILGFLVAFPLFGSLFAAKRKCLVDDGKTSKVDTGNLHILPKALLCSAVTPILLVYVLFFISQWSYYVSAFTGVRPEGFTFADYARSGFFELCWVSGINAVMLLLFRLLIRRKEGEKGVLQGIYSALISFFTLVLIATALSKMVLYVATYGLTQKRVYASWFMVLLAFIFIVVLVAQFIKRIRLIPVILALCVLFFGLIALPDVDGMIASYNVDAYLTGELESADIETISSYGASAVPALVELRDTLSGYEELSDSQAQVLSQTQDALSHIKQQLSEQPNHFFTFNLPTARARNLLK